MMVMYTTAMGVSAGAGLILVPRLWAKVCHLPMPMTRLDTRPVSAVGWGITLGVPGIALTILGGLMSVTWPLIARPFNNTIFGEPAFFLGLLMLAAATWLVIRGGHLEEEGLREVLTPVASLIAGLGLILGFCTLAIARFEAIGAAPPIEPLTGLISLPAVENTAFAAVYGLAALGCLLAPATVGGSRRAWTLLYWSWTLSGAFFVIFSALNYYTHTGMVLNQHLGTDYRW